MSNITNFYDTIPKEFKRDKYNNPNRLAPQHPFRMLIIGSAGSGKTNFALNILQICQCFTKIYLYGIDLAQPLWEYLITTLTKVGEEKGSKILEFSNDPKEIPKPEQFDSSLQNLVIIDDMVLEKKIKTVEELYTRGRNNGVSIMFLSQSFYKIPKIIRSNANYICLRNIVSKRDLQLICSEFSLDIPVDKLTEMYQIAVQKPMSFFVIDLVTTDPNLKFRVNFEPEKQTKYKKK